MKKIKKHFLFLFIIAITLTLFVENFAHPQSTPTPTPDPSTQCGNTTYNPADQVCCDASQSTICNKDLTDLTRYVCCHIPAMGVECLNVEQSCCNGAVCNGTCCGTNVYNYTCCPTGGRCTNTNTQCCPGNQTVCNDQCCEAGQVCGNDGWCTFCGNSVIEIDKGEECDPPGSLCSNGLACDNACKCPVVPPPTPSPTPTPTPTPPTAGLPLPSPPPQNNCPDTYPILCGLWNQNTLGCKCPGQTEFIGSKTGLEIAPSLWLCCTNHSIQSIASPSFTNYCPSLFPNQNSSLQCNIDGICARGETCNTPTSLNLSANCFCVSSAPTPTPTPLPGPICTYYDNACRNSNGVADGSCTGVSAGHCYIPSAGAVCGCYP